MHYVTNYNLEDLELFFRLAGFSAFTEEELPNSIVMPMSINLTNKNNVHSGCFGGLTNEEDATKFIEDILGKNVISKYKNIKKKQLLHKRNSLLASLQEIDQELDSAPAVYKLRGKFLE